MNPTDSQESNNKKNNKAKKYAHINLSISNQIKTIIKIGATINL